MLNLCLCLSLRHIIYEFDSQATVPSTSWPNLARIDENVSGGGKRLFFQVTGISPSAIHTSTLRTTAAGESPSLRTHCEMMNDQVDTVAWRLKQVQRDCIIYVVPPFVFEQCGEKPITKQTSSADSPSKTGVVANGLLLLPPPQPPQPPPPPLYTSSTDNNNSCCCCCYYYYYHHYDDDSGCCLLLRRRLRLTILAIPLITRWRVYGSLRPCPPPPPPTHRAPPGL